jgi:hypothetical protein
VDAPPDPLPKASPAVPATSRPAAPAITWEFNEGRDSVVGDGANGATSGRIVGGPEWVSGRQTGAMRFDGKDDYVELNAPIPDAEVISIEAWIRLDPDAEGINTIVCDGDAGAEADFWLGLEPQAVVICASKESKALGDGRTNGNQSFERVLLDHDIRGKWVHLVWSMNDAQSVVYIDGKPAGMIARGGSNVGNHNAHPTIGCFSVGSGRNDTKRPPTKFFKGDIDSLRLYPQALTDDQVAELFAGPAKTPAIARKRRAVPPAATLDAVIKTVRDTFKDDYAAKTPDARKVLGDRLMVAAESETDLAMQFVLIREARDAYAGAGEVDRALQAASALAERFIVSAAESKLDALTIAIRGPNLAGNGKAIAEGAMGAANVLVAAGKYSQALKALSIADTGAKGTKDSPLGSLIRDRSKEIK